MRFWEFVGKAFPRAVFLLFIFVVGVCFLDRLLMPKYTGRVLEGSLIEEYYRDEGRHELLFLGDCEVYENISPATLWQEFGITSYIRGSAQQLIPQSYYLLMDTLIYEKPKVVVLSVAAMQQGEQNNESYNRMTLDGMRWSRWKYEAIRETMLSDEHMIEYALPLLRFHDRWSSLEADDFRYLIKKPLVSHKGYYLRADVRPLQQFPTERRLRNPAFPEKNFDYLERIRKVCDENGICLVLFKAPSLYPAWHEEWELQVRDYADQHGLLYINALSELEDIGIDFETDTYDGGLHMNVYGAEKLSRYLGPRLLELGVLKDYREDPGECALWDVGVLEYNKAKVMQEEEFREHGYLSRFAESAA